MSGTARRGEAHGLRFWGFFIYLLDLQFGFDCCRFWVMLLSVMGLGVANGLKLMGFG
jgi:hypothetical protein